MEMFASGFLVMLKDKEACTYTCSMYDCNGAFLPFGDIRRKEQSDNDFIDGTDVLIWKILIEEYDIDDALSITAGKLEEKLVPIKRRVLGISRTGMLEEWEQYTFYADDSVTDDWLFTQFAMRIRDRMLIFASQRKHGKCMENSKDYN